MALDSQLLEILACPDVHHAPLRHDPAADTLTCTECGRVFPIRDDIPVLLLDEATVPGSTAPTGTAPTGTAATGTAASPTGPAPTPDGGGRS